MKKLNRMLFREIRTAKAQFIAVVTVVLLGIAAFTATFISYRNLKNSKDYYYEQYKFLDYYASVKALDLEAVNKIRAIEGIKAAEGRISIDAGADMDETKRVTVRLLSLPEDRRPFVNDLYMVKGDYFNSGGRGCLVSKSFAKFYNLEPGSTLKIILKDKIYELPIKGIVESPEYIYEIKAASSPVPSPEDFGIVYINESQLEEMTHMKGVYNEVHVTFVNDKDIKKTIKKIEEALKAHGFISGVTREEQISNAMVSNEIEEMKEIAVAFPLLFLSVAAMIIYIMLRRIVSNQRTIIGVMKAMGYKNKRILWHYIIYALLIGVIGAVIGTALGMCLGFLLTAMYNGIFSIPVMKVKLYPELFLISTLLSLSFCLAAGYGSAKRVLRIQPAEAMRSAVPKAGRRIMLEKVKFIWNRISFGTKMSIRNVFRNRKRALLTALSTSLTMMFIMVAMFFMDSIDYILKQHFTKFQSQDYKITYSIPQSMGVLNDINNIKGVVKSEPIMEFPFELRKDGKLEDTIIVGISNDSSFYSLFGKNKKTIPLSGEGILVAERLAGKLSLEVGDTITISVYDSEKDIKVAGIIKQYVGHNCYMNIEELQSLTGFKDSISGTLLKIDTDKEAEIRKELLKDVTIFTIEDRQKSYENFKGLMEFLYIFFIVMIVFGIVMGFSIVFNTTVINVIERKRELASLKVLGYSKSEIEKTVFKENMFLGIFALIPGLTIGRVMCSIFAKQFSNEFFTFEIYISLRTYFIAALCMFAFIAVAQLANRRNIVGLDMIEVLKDREG